MRALVIAVLLGWGSVSSAQETVRPWVGVAIVRGEGIVIETVLPKTPAERAGLRAGDQVVAIDGQRVSTASELIERIQAKGVGEKVTLTVRRGSATKQATMALEPRPDELALVRDHLLDKRAPGFALEAIGPYPAKLASLSGNVVVLEFWATWCSACNAAMPRLAEWQKRFGPRGLRIVGVTDEPLDVVRAYAKRKGVGHTLASDPEGAVSLEYRVPAVPTFVVIDRAGRVRHVDVGGGSRLDGVEAAVRRLLEGS